MDSDTFDVVKWIISLVLVTAGSVWALLKVFFTKWLDDRYRKVDEANRQDHEKELVRLRLFIDNELSRSRFIGVKQFDIVSDLWVNIMETYWIAQQVFNPLHRSVEMRDLSEQDRLEYLTGINAPGWLVRKIEEAAVRNDTSQMNDILFRYQQRELLTNAINKSAIAFRELDKVGILLPIDLHDAYRSFLVLAQNALREKQSTDELGLAGPDYNKDRELFRSKSIAMRDDLLTRTRAFLVEAQPA